MNVNFHHKCLENHSYQSLKAEYQMRLKFPLRRILKKYTLLRSYTIEHMSNPPKKTKIMGGSDDNLIAQKIDTLQEIRTLKSYETLQYAQK